MAATMVNQCQLDLIDQLPLQGFKVPKLKSRDVYKFSVFQWKEMGRIGKCEVNAKIHNDEGVQLSFLPLFNEKQIEKIENSGCGCIHFGAFQIIVIPLIACEINPSSFIALLDSRHTTFSNAVVGAFRCPLGEGVKFVTMFPGFAMATGSGDFAKGWSILIQTKGLHTEMGSEYMAVGVKCVYSMGYRFREAIHKPLSIVTSDSSVRQIPGTKFGQIPATVQKFSMPVRFDKGSSTQKVILQQGDSSAVQRDDDEVSSLTEEVESCIDEILQKGELYEYGLNRSIRAGFGKTDRRSLFK